MPYWERRFTTVEQRAVAETDILLELCWVSLLARWRSTIWPPPGGLGATARAELDRGRSIEVLESSSCVRRSHRPSDQIDIVNLLRTMKPMQSRTFRLWRLACHAGARRQRTVKCSTQFHCHTVAWPVESRFQTWIVETARPSVTMRHATSTIWRKQRLSGRLQEPAPIQRRHLVTMPGVSQTMAAMPIRLPTMLIHSGHGEVSCKSGHSGL